MSDVLSQENTQKTPVETQPVQDIVEVTDLALEQVQDILKKNPNTIGIRLGVVGGGCAGLSYQMTPCEEAIEGDLVQEVNGVRFYIHPMAAAYLKGTTLDYSQSVMESGFKFVNPNASSTCGCGSSFGV